MIEAQMMTSLVATLFGLLVLILGWMGNKLYSKLESMDKTITTIAGDLHTRINGIDNRLAKVEAVCVVQHGGHV